MERILEALVSFRPIAEKCNNIKTSKMIDKLIQIIDLSIYNRLRYSEIMGHFTQDEFTLITQALRTYYDNKQADTLISLFQKKCSL